MPRLANKYAPDFQSAIEQIALKWEMAPEAVFSLWRKYVVACHAIDQSPVLSEFKQWVTLTDEKP